MADKKYVFSFKEAHEQKLGKEILGGKGFGLAEMTAAGVNIPAGFTISTEACNLYYKSGKQIPDYVWNDVVAHLHEVEKLTGKEFGGKGMPLLVSVRSGARTSMPGMMDTILNLGLNDDTVEAMVKATGNERFAYIIERLTSDAKSASSAMSKSAEYANKQNELITETGSQLDTIKSGTDELRDGVIQVKGSVDEVINANTEIMDNITNLSATSEEVAAATDTVGAVSDDAMDALSNMNDTLEVINKIAREMEEMALK